MKNVIKYLVEAKLNFDINTDDIDIGSLSKKEAELLRQDQATIIYALEHAKPDLLNDPILQSELITNIDHYIKYVNIKRDDYIIIKYLYDLNSLNVLDERLKNVFDKYQWLFKLLSQIKKVEKIKVKSKQELKKIIGRSAIHANLNHLDVSGITNMSKLFEGRKFDGDISEWDVSNVVNMEEMFSNSSFNGDLSKWDVSHVVDMRAMFSQSKFNNNSISNWNVSNVIDMNGMFYDSEFNSDISKWNTSKVIVMSGMFAFSKFNGDISKWNTSNVEYMSGMFEMYNYTIDISKWNTSKVKDMSDMFRQSKFNGDISKWNVGNVENMDHMFAYSEFDGDIGDWDMHSVHSTREMFCKCNFSGKNCSNGIKSWNFENLENSDYMFSGNTKFNIDISQWNLPVLRVCSSMFSDSIFDHDISTWDFSNRKEIFCDGMFTGCPIKDEYRPKGDPTLFIPWYERKNY